MLKSVRKLEVGQFFQYIKQFSAATRTTVSLSVATQAHIAGIVCACTVSRPQSHLHYANYGREKPQGYVFKCS